MYLVHISKNAILHRLKTSKRYFVPIFFLFSFFISSNSLAQLCTGSLGDPIVNITFGAGGNPGPPLTAAAIGYQYSANDCPTDGSYSIRNSTIACFANSWHTVNTDHTGNSNGYFMLVNASNSPGDFYVDTVRGLCSGTTYQFSAWLMNVLLQTSCGGNGNRPNITFSIERTNGAVIQQYNTNNINTTATPQWFEYGFFFVMPSGTTDLVLRLRNNAPGGCGNDLLLDDITFRPCGPVLTSSIIGAGSLKEVCEGDTTTVFFQSVISSGFNDPHFQWQHMNNSASVWVDIPGANSSSHSVFVTGNAIPGEYYYRVTAVESANAGNASCRVASQMLKVRVNPRPAISISTPGPVCVGDNVTITGSGGGVYQWYGPNAFNSKSPTIQFPSVTMAEAGKYYLTVSNSTGCTRYDSTTLVVNAVPTALVVEDSFGFCEGRSVQLQASGGATYLWSPASGLSSTTSPSPTATPGDSTIYQVIVFNSLSCSDTAYVEVNVHENPKAYAGTDLVIIEGEGVIIDAYISGSDWAASWSPSDYYITGLNSLQPFVSPPRDTAYILNVVSRQGCAPHSDTVRVRVLKNIVISNVFTPNGDGVNDLWTIRGLDSYPDHDVRVFNSYGQLVYESKRYTSWNGSYKGNPLPVGTYYYIILVPERGRFSGYVDILR